MIKLKTKIVRENNDSLIVEVKNYKISHSNTLEHIFAIDTLVFAIMENQKDMTINDLCKIIKSNYKTRLEEKENEQYE